MKDRRLPSSGQIKKYMRKKNPARAGSFVLKNLCSPNFPLFFLLRNLGWLRRERCWEDLPPRARGTLAARMVGERILFFSKVRAWRKTRAATPGTGGNGQSAPPGYCNKCGLCCEVASGMPDFPADCELPAEWRATFADGLGRGHRFCPFLWEDDGPASGLCSIYPWRSNPCRLFGRDECDFFWQHPEPEEISSERTLLLMRRWLANLINGRKLPLARSDVPAKRPKLLELHRV